MSRLPSNGADVGAVLLMDEATTVHERDDGRILRNLIGAGPRTAVQVATASGLSPAATLRTLARLIERGFVAVTDGAGGVAAYRLSQGSERTAVGDPWRRILLVEDDSAVRELMELLLEGQGYAVIVARTPAEATAILAAVAFDLVIIDGFSTAPTAVVTNTLDVLKAAGGTPVALFTAHRIGPEAARRRLSRSARQTVRPRRPGEPGPHAARRGARRSDDLQHARGETCPTAERHMATCSSSRLAPIDMLRSMDSYPDSGSAVVPLATGEQAILRPIRPDDAPRLQALVGRLSPEARYRRFFSHRRTLPAAEAARFAQVDGHTRLAIVAERPTPGGPDLIGVARCDVVEPGVPRIASVAMVVEDRFQRAGLGRALIEVLVAAARAAGIARFEGDVQTENHPMLAFLREAGFPVTVERRGTEIHFIGEIGPSGATRA